MAPRRRTRPCRTRRPIVIRASEELETESDFPTVFRGDHARKSENRDQAGGAVVPMMLDVRLSRSVILGDASASPAYFRAR